MSEFSASLLLHVLHDPPPKIAMLKIFQRYTSRTVSACLSHAVPLPRVSTPAFRNNRGIQHITSQVTDQGHGVVGLPFQMSYANADYIDTFHNPLKSYRKASHALCNENIPPIEGFVRLVNEQDAKELVNLRKLDHPYVLNLIALTKVPSKTQVPNNEGTHEEVKYAGLTGNFKCSLESYLSDQSRLDKFCIYHTDPNGVKESTILSPLGQDFIRKILVGTFVSNEASLSVIYEEGIFICGPLNSSTLNVKLGRLTCKTDSPSRCVVRLKGYLKKHIFRPLKLDEGELDAAFSVAQSELLSKEELSEILEQPLFDNLAERFSLLSELNDVICSMGVSVGDLFLDTFLSGIKSTYSGDWEALVGYALFAEMAKRAAYNQVSNGGYMRFWRNSIAHQSAIKKNFGNAMPVPIPNVLGDRNKDAMLYFIKLRPQFFLQLYASQDSFPPPLQRVRGLGV